LELLTKADILATDVADYRQVLSSEQARINGYVMDLEHPVAGRIPVTGCPVTLNHEITHEAGPVPEHGQHSEQVLLEIDYTWEQISALRDASVI
jgi:crotonobetainyl-CoA:carnitine CoA-transferase CaiB-like acyl-CoA transferase